MNFLIEIHCVGWKIMVANTAGADQKEGSLFVA
jgi:hypothetical protein